MVCCVARETVVWHETKRFSVAPICKLHRASSDKLYFGSNLEVPVLKYCRSPCVTSVEQLQCGIKYKLQCGIPAEAQCGISAEAQCGISAEAQCGIPAEAQCGIPAEAQCGIPAEALVWHLCRSSVWHLCRSSSVASLQKL